MDEISKNGKNPRKSCNDSSCGLLYLCCINKNEAMARTAVVSTGHFVELVAGGSPIGFGVQGNKKR